MLQRRCSEATSVVASAIPRHMTIEIEQNEELVSFGQDTPSKKVPWEVDYER